jgi:hypothetical protein
MNAETEIKATRIEVPVELPVELSEPHFEDEATVATARQVVPIERARSIEFRRKVRTLLPILLGAMLCGGLGAAGVNYYEHRQATPAVSSPAPTVSAQPPVTESTPMAVAVSTDPATDTNINETASGEARGFSSKSEPKTEEKRAEDAPKKADNPRTAAPKNKENTSVADASKLTRKRRVHPDDEAARPNKSKGAARIVDVFTGKNPE